ncbi:hypothetical protein QN399_16095 [Pseudomonas sp. 10C3]|uniref:hypothetical protein n=1 Tax=Pseudomonas sp. 10C3 TaxID=3118753 RepID=UPI002E817363|nr:hypothetical protein [Pseudomonas sp. 10C3]MEE3507759.1 hypothetical protein [Pseudomonas sp. 10C3]
MLNQMSLELPSQPVQPRLRIVPRLKIDSGPPPAQLAFDFTAVFARIPRRPIRSTICAGATLITRDGVTLPAAEWAARLGLKWQTVKMRRLRGDNWSDALAPELRRSTFMSGWKMHG